MVEAIGMCAAVLTMFSFVPQVYKMLKCKSARDVSLATLIQLSTGVAFWLVYGVIREDAIIIGANAVTLVTLITALFLYFKFTRSS